MHRLLKASGLLGQAILAAHNLNVNGAGSGGSTALSTAGQPNAVSAPPGGTFGRDESGLPRSSCSLVLHKTQLYIFVVILTALACS